MKLFCVRHGETFYNLASRIQGQSDSELTPLGRRQCQAVAEALGTLAIDAIIASPLARARATAEHLADRLSLPVELDDRLMEIHAGIFQGLAWNEIHDRFPEESCRWRSQDPDYRIPGGESRRDLMSRTGEVFWAIRERGLRQVIVVAHGGSLSAAFKILLGIPAERNPFTLANCSISTGHWEKEFKLLALNETGHLRDVLSGGSEM
jgi:broad specificity phosphatase PhoE